MEPEIKTDVLALIKKVIKSLKRCDADALKAQSDQVIHSAGIYQDADTITIAVIVYALSKLVAREKAKPSMDGECQKKIVERFIVAQKALKSDNLRLYRQTMKAIMKELARLDKRFEMYVMEVVEQARIKKGKKIFEHGISLGRAAEIMGISSWELMSYLGKTKISDVKVDIVPVDERLSLARRLFR